jgi:hypothetical protein
VIHGRHPECPPPLALFLAPGTLASTILLPENPRLCTAALLAIAVWAFARAYDFAFYVIECYIDRSDRFAGFLSFLRYLVRRRGGREP